MIPTARHIVLDELEEALALGPQAFLERHHFPKPEKNDHVIFYCRSGGRSMHALRVAEHYGFTNAQNYSGSMNEWSEKEYTPMRVVHSRPRAKKKAPLLTRLIRSLFK